MKRLPAVLACALVLSVLINAALLVRLGPGPDESLQSRPGLPSAQDSPDVSASVRTPVSRPPSAQPLPSPYKTPAPPDLNAARQEIEENNPLDAALAEYEGALTDEHKIIEFPYLRLLLWRNEFDSACALVEDVMSQGGADYFIRYINAVRLVMPMYSRVFAGMYSSSRPRLEEPDPAQTDKETEIYRSAALDIYANMINRGKFTAFSFGAELSQDLYDGTLYTRLLRKYEYDTGGTPGAYHLIAQADGVSVYQQDSAGAVIVDGETCVLLDWLESDTTFWGAPHLMKRDLDGDGAKEIAFSSLYNWGTGLYTDLLHVLEYVEEDSDLNNRYHRYEDHVLTPAMCADMLKDRISYVYDSEKNSVVMTFDGAEYSADLSAAGPAGMTKITGVHMESVVDFSFENGRIKMRMQIEFEYEKNMQPFECFELWADVLYSGGRFGFADCKIVNID